MENVKRVPKCGRCRNHGVDSVLKGHKTSCRWRDCPCDMCNLISLRKQLSGKLISIKRRERTKENEPKSEEEFCHADLPAITTDIPQKRPLQDSFQENQFSSGGRFLTAIQESTQGLLSRNELCGACCFGDSNTMCTQFCSPMWSVAKDPTLIASSEPVSTNQAMDNYLGNMADKGEGNSSGRIQSSLDLLSYVADAQSPQPVNNREDIGEERHVKRRDTQSHQVSQQPRPQLQGNVNEYRSPIPVVPDGTMISRFPPDSYGGGIPAESQLPMLGNNGFQINQQFTSTYDAYYSKVQPQSALSYPPPLQGNNTWYRHMYNINNVPMTELQQSSQMSFTRCGDSVTSTSSTGVDHNQRIIKEDPMAVWRPYSNTANQ